MKKLFFIALFFTAWWPLSAVLAQTVNGVRLSEIKSTYIELWEVKKTFSDKIWIGFAYGQKVAAADDYIIKDDNNKDLAFNSAIDAVNKLTSYGYELFQVYTVQTDSTDFRKYYVLKKK